MSLDHPWDQTKQFVYVFAIVYNIIERFMKMLIILINVIFAKN